MNIDLNNFIASARIIAEKKETRPKRINYDVLALQNVVKKGV